MGQPSGGFDQGRAFPKRRNGQARTVRAGTKSDLLLWLSIHRIDSSQAAEMWIPRISDGDARSAVVLQYVRKRLPKIYTRELVGVIFKQLYCRIGNLVEKNIAQRQSASRYLKELTAIGVLREVQTGKEKLFIHPKLMQLLANDGNAFIPYA
jgi:hypothetical protein